MKNSTAKKRIEKAMREALKNETEKVIQYFCEIAFLTFKNLEDPSEKELEPYSSSHNLQYAIDTVLVDDFYFILKEAKSETEEE